MGAQLWHHAAPWHDDPSVALFEFQTSFLSETYDLPALVQEHLESAREAVRITEAEGDEYGLLDMYREHLAMLEGLANRPLPTDPRQQIELVRRIYQNSGQGIGNVLDVTHVSDRGGELKARPWTVDEIRRFCNFDQPTRRQAEAGVFGINEELSRGECVCFPFYDEPSRNPIGWYFVGNTID